MLSFIQNRGRIVRIGKKRPFYRMLINWRNSIGFICEEVLYYWGIIKQISAVFLALKEKSFGKLQTKAIIPKRIFYTVHLAISKYMVFVRFFLRVSIVI